MPGVVLFIDSPILLHFRPLVEIPWKDLFKAESVRLVICLPVINEVDTKTYDPRLGDRASRSLAEFEEKKGQEIQAEVYLDFMNYIPRREEYPVEMNPEHKDDRVIRCAQIYAERHPDHGPVIMVSEDRGMVLRCPGFGLRVERLPSSWKLANVTDDLTKKIRRLEADFLAERNRRPHLILEVLPVAAHQCKEAGTGLRPSRLFRSVNVAEAVNQKRRQHPKIGISDSPFDIESAMRGTLLGREEIAKYNADLEKYYQTCERHFREMNEWLERRGRFYDFELHLENQGKALATNMVVELDFPAHVNLLDAEEKTDRRDPIPLLVPPPSEPEPGRGLFPMPPVFRGGLRDDPPNPDLPMVKVSKKKGRIACSLTKLLHNDHRLLGSFVFWLPGDKPSSPFEAAYSIMAAEVPDKVEGRIPFIIEP